MIFSKAMRLVPSLQRMLIVPVMAIATVAFVAAGYPQAAAPVMTPLHAAPSGQAHMSWDPLSQNLWVTISMTGLDPNTSHLAHIHAGSCGNDRGIVYPLATINADSNGNAYQITEIPNVAKGIAASGWFINVHLGGNASSAVNLTPIACGNIANQGASTDWPQFVTTDLYSSFTVSSMAMLQIVNGNLVVHLHISGLTPGSRHSAHIHSGSCTYQGDVLYPLTTLVADNHGYAAAMTTIQGVSSIGWGWYINVHYGDLSTSHTMAAHAPIVCGDIAA